MTAEVLAPRFEEGRWARPIRDLGLSIDGTPLEGLVREVERELDRAGLVRVRPRFYLSTEWGVPMNTVAVAIPFYLASPELTQIHAERAGLIEGIDADDILRYLRHEVGHVINYAYRLYEREDWVRTFGSITQPYVEEYRPQPFNPRYVVNLPGWYAQKHPDEDWAETFAIWLTPALDWRAEYTRWPLALRKLEVADRILHEIRHVDPLVTEVDLDEDVRSIGYTVDQYYRDQDEIPRDSLPELSGALRTIFPRQGRREALPGAPPVRPASALIASLELALLRDVYRWTGHFPERTRALLRALAEEADRLDLAYAAEDERGAIVSFTALTTALAMNHVLRGTYLH